MGGFVDPASMSMSGAVGTNGAPATPAAPLSFKYRLMLLAAEFETLELDNINVKEELRLVRLQQDEDAGSVQGKQSQKTPQSPDRAGVAPVLQGAPVLEGGGGTPTGVLPTVATSRYVPLYKKQTTPGVTSLTRSETAVTGTGTHQEEWPTTVSAMPLASVIGASQRGDMSPASATSISSAAGMDEPGDEVPRHVLSHGSELSMLARSGEPSFTSASVSSRRSASRVHDPHIYMYIYMYIYIYI